MKLPPPLLALASELNIHRIHRVTPLEAAGPNEESGLNEGTNTTDWVETEVRIISVTPDWLETATPDQRPELLWVTAATLQTDPDAAMQRLGRARNIVSSRVVTELIDLGPAPTDIDLLSLGFIRYAETATGSVTSRWYLFDLMTYKPVPDWLNARFWANPDNWDKFRW